MSQSDLTLFTFWHFEIMVWFLLRNQTLAHDHVDSYNKNAPPPPKKKKKNQGPQGNQRG